MEKQQCGSDFGNSMKTREHCDQGPWETFFWFM